MRFDDVQAEAARHHQEQMRLWSEAMERGDIEAVKKIDIGGGSINDIKQKASDHADNLIRAALREFRGDESMGEEDFSRLCMYAGRVYGPRCLLVLDVYKCLDPSIYAEVVSDVWGMAEYPLMSMRKTDWLALWRKAGFTIDNVRAEDQRPKEPLVLWRSAHPTYKRGLSWTDSRKVAEWFQQARYGTQRLYQCEVPPDRLLARIHEQGRGEHEWIADVKTLPIIELKQGE